MSSEAVNMIRNAVAGGASLSGAVRDLKMLGVPGQVVDAAKAEYEKSVQNIIEMKDPGALVEKELIEGAWYAGPSDDHLFWPHLRSNLKPLLPHDALETIDSSSNRIVGLMRPPGAPKIRTRGLVLGHVQSGKTTSFMSVAAKTADVGYRMVIVLSGITDNLRSQTQARLEEQLVGGLDAKWLKLTDLDCDFQKSGNAAAYLTSSSHKLLAVVKKNPYRLRRLAEWIESAGEAAQLSCPILIIDDEADQASIDVGKKRMSVINGLVRRLLLNPKSAYVAYTATPFANLLIDPSIEEGLYPRDFVLTLKAGDGYYGPERLFGRDLLEHLEDDAAPEPDDVVRPVPLDEVPAVQPPKGVGAVYCWEPTLPPSLADAVEWFVLATAARWVRGNSNVHSSMLVHTSMLSEAHFRLQAVIRDHCDELAREIEFESDTAWARLEELWAEEYGRVGRNAGEDEVSWAQVRSHLPAVLASLQVIVDNFRSDVRLEYKQNEASTVIAIGGNTLSRGLTLEGLTSSYFVRAASAYDTLLQMGRWFGYRNGYSDLVRIWMTDELRDWFRDLATVEAEIRQEILRYEAEGLKPSQLAVKIRTHPAMAITAAAKMRAAVQATLDYSGKREQTILFCHQDKTWLAGNWEAAERLIIAAAAAPGAESGRVDGSGRFVMRSVPVGVVLNFLDDYSFHPNAMRLKTSLLMSYIQQEASNGGLLSWNVVVLDNEKPLHGTRQLSGAGPVNLISRSRMNQPTPGTANIKALVGSTDRAGDLGSNFLSSLGPNPSDSQIAIAREKVAPQPLLALYPIGATAAVDKKRKDRVPLGAVDDVLAVSFFFPRAVSPSSGVTYVAADLSEAEVEVVEQELDDLDKQDKEAGDATSEVESGEVLP